MPPSYLPRNLYINLCRGGNRRIKGSRGIIYLVNLVNCLEYQELYKAYLVFGLYNIYYIRIDIIEIL